MKIAIVHFHLNRGGVTRVILNHLQGLARHPPGEPIQVLLLYGGRQQGWPDDLAATLSGVSFEQVIVPALEYDEGVRHDVDLADALSKSLSRHGFAPEETVLHIHNHSLGKNVSLPGAIAILARRGQRCLLQVHDFAEDFRPTNFRRLSVALAQEQGETGQGETLAGLLYPQSARIHYALLNARDRSVLSGAGVPASRLHLLPNPVALPEVLPARELARKRLNAEYGIAAKRRFVLYPVRGIRRKNLGEMLLWAALAQERASFGVTLRPVNPAEARSYDLCAGIARELRIPAIFGVGGQLTFAENLSAADYLLTTSVAEGFGMVFLESWLAGCPLVGRNLPEITLDFQQGGLSLAHLYDRLDIPVDWIGAEAVRRCLSGWYERIARVFGLPFDAAETKASIDRMLEPGYVDFAQLSLSDQVSVVRRVAADGVARDALLQWNSKLKNAFEIPPERIQQLIQHNQGIVRQTYSLEAASRRLVALYRLILADTSPDQEIESLPAGGSILKSFLDVSRLQPLRLE